MLLAGREGSGKSSVFETFIGTLIGDNHFVHIHSASDVVGEFNSILQHKILAFFDEAMTGSKRDEYFEEPTYCKSTKS